MSNVNRRQFLRASALLATTAAVGACGNGSGSSKGTGDKKLRWWDHSPNLQAINKKTWAKFAKMPGGMPVEYTYQQTSKMGQALQLAKQSNQLPDIHTNVGLTLPVPALIQAGWFQPMALDDPAMARVKDTLIDGVHVFDGKVYSFPIFANKQYWAANWFNKDLLEKSGLDPANPPKTYDEFRAACRTVKQKGGGKVYGWIFNLGFPQRMVEQITYLAQAAGSTALQSGVDIKTGEYVFHNDAYVTVIEFLLSLQKDGLLVPGSSSLNDNAARSRWEAGAAAFFFDGPWCPGVVLKDSKAFLDKVGVGPMLVPQSGMPVTAYRGPQGGNYWLSGQAKQVAAANKLLGLVAQQDYAIGIAEGMAQPPADPEAVAKANVHPAYRQLIEWYNKDAFLAPVPEGRNVDVTKVYAEQKGVKPTLGDLVQGMFSGQVTDVRGALKQLSDKSAKERDRAIGEAKKKGANVSLDDWAFPDWQPRVDYTRDKYKKK